MTFPILLIRKISKGIFQISKRSDLTMSNNKENQNKENQNNRNDNNKNDNKNNNKNNENNNR